MFGAASGADDDNNPATNLNISDTLVSAVKLLKYDPFKLVCQSFDVGIPTFMLLELRRPVRYSLPDMVIEPVTVVFVLTTKPFVGDIEAVELPLAIWDKFNPVTPLAGTLYRLPPSPLNEPVKNDAVIFPVMKIEPVLTVFVEINSSTDGPREPETAM